MDILVLDKVLVQLEKILSASWWNWKWFKFSIYLEKVLEIFLNFFLGCSINFAIINNEAGAGYTGSFFYLDTKVPSFLTEYKRGDLQNFLIILFNFS